MIVMLLYDPTISYAQSKYPVGTIRNLDSLTVASLISELKGPEENWGARALESYFGSVYSPKLPDLVVYIDPDTIRQQLTKDHKFVKDQQLNGEEFLYILVFVDGQLITTNNETEYNVFCPPPIDSLIQKDSSSGSTLVVGRTSLAHRPDPFLRRAISAFSRILASVTLPKTSENLEDLNKEVQLVNVGTSQTDSSNLYLGFVKMSIAENTWTRISICGSKNIVLPQETRAIITNFGNTSYSVFTVGFALGAALGAADTTQTYSEVRPNLYMYTTLYHKQQAPPLTKRLFGLFLGTSITPSGFLDDIIFGVSISNLFRGSPTMMVGATLFPVKDKEGRVTPFIGIGFEF